MKAFQEPLLEYLPTDRGVLLASGDNDFGVNDNDWDIPGGNYYD